jgi:hypothetical protein
MFILPQAIPSFAALSLPSLNGFPLVGLLWFLLLLLLAVVGLGGAIWMAKEHEEHGIAQADRWFLAIGLVLVAVLVGVLQIGPIALLPAAPAMATTLFYFTKQRDKRVEKSRRILTKDFVTNIRATIREHIASSAAVSPGNAPREPLLARLKSVMLKLNERAVKKSQTAKKKEARPELHDIFLLKKD